MKGDFGVGSGKWNIRMGFLRLIPTLGVPPFVGPVILNPLDEDVDEDPRTPVETLGPPERRSNQTHRKRTSRTWAGRAQSCMSLGVSRSCR